MNELDEMSLSEKPGGAEWVYAKLVGLEVERLPELSELPAKLFLPPVVIGDLEEMILQTHRDGRERGQSVGWRNSRFVVHNVCIGNNDSVS